MAAAEGDGERRTGDEGFAAYGIDPKLRDAMRGLIERALATAGPDFGDAMRATKASFAGAKPVELMGALAMYFGTAEAGSNPEFTRSNGVFWHHLELAQAFAFRAIPSDDDQAEPPFKAVEPAVRALRKLTDAWILLEARKVQQASPGRDRDLASVLLRLRVNAMALRGWGYHDRIVGLLEDLLAPLDARVKPSLGWRPSALPRWWTAIVGAMNSRLDAHRAAVREAVEWPVDGTWLTRLRDRFAALPVEDEAVLIAQATADEELRRGFVYHSSDLVAHEIFRCGLDELVGLFPDGDVEPKTVRNLLRPWSLHPGRYGELDPGRFFLENPVLERPFVGSEEDRWHLFCPWLLFHNPFGLLEAVLGADKDLFDIYLRRRADFLEERTGAILADALPGAQVETAILHTNPSDGREYENDALAVVDSYAVIAEAKAGRLGPEARRGHRRRLRQRITALVDEPSQQAERLANHLAADSDVKTFRRKRDDSEFELDAGAIRRVLTLGVTLEPIAGLLPRLSEVADAGLTERTAGALAHSISLTDLELVADVLAHPSEVLHYLGRRAEIERRDFLQGDEVDLLGLYLQTGLNLGEREFSGRDNLDVTGMSDPIDLWHYRREAGLEAEPPRVKRVPWWEAVLSRVESRRGMRWPEIGVSLCNVGPPEQDDLEASMRQLRAEIAAGERPATDLLVFHNGPPERRDVFIGVIATSPDRNERATQYENAARIAMGKHDDLKSGIVIAWTPQPIAAPYFALVYFDRRECGSQ